MKTKILNLLKSISPESDFENSSNFLADGLMDSFDVVVITTALEECFKINIPGDQITPENFESLDRLHELVIRSTV
jgi:acyl carrier protein